MNVFGLADVVADNSRGASDLLVKLIDRDAKPMTAVRVDFLKAKQRFTMERVKPGHYDIRCKNPDTRRMRESQMFAVRKKKTRMVMSTWDGRSAYTTSSAEPSNTATSLRESSRSFAQSGRQDLPWMLTVGVEDAEQ